MLLLGQLGVDGVDVVLLGGELLRGGVVLLGGGLGVLVELVDLVQQRAQGGLGGGQRVGARRGGGSGDGVGGGRGERRRGRGRQGQGRHRQHRRAAQRGPHPRLARGRLVVTRHGPHRPPSPLVDPQAASRGRSCHADPESGRAHQMN
ncbi:hypothetical protein E6W39_15970 [Kitasatospora acidiphila]|uniref:Uncharacterized protein n=1 Tax=Kitasatospora acidiphila TaxID=2567942 RepID=A0A540W347_9ACTN|nr:hypothetical protein E6W39_15970 [Kitasatospora acidiphila]